MVRASTAGMIDFRRFDPWDSWCWKNLRWILNELETKQTAEVCSMQHNHWVTMASHSNLTEDSFSNAKTNAGNAFNKYLKATYTWLADKIGEDGTRSDREEAVEAYHREMGRPGDPHYEAMVDTISNALKKGPMSERAKARDRARRRAEREAAAANK